MSKFAWIGLGVILAGAVKGSLAEGICLAVATIVLLWEVLKDWEIEFEPEEVSK